MWNTGETSKSAVLTKKKKCVRPTGEREDQKNKV